jgi:acetyl-CoA carboxylase biotin carboxyl carrier protein
MIPKRLQELLEFAETTDLQEVWWEKRGALVNFRRLPSAAPKKAQVAPGANAPPAPAVTPSAPKTPESLTIRSTMVGTFYRSDSQDRPPFVVEGTVVTAGQPVAAIEAMKIMKDVIAPGPCRIVKAVVANGHPVEYGQPLFEIESLPPAPLPGGEGQAENDLPVEAAQPLQGVGGSVG